MQVKLPFTIEGANRCSFTVEINGRRAFISNHNLLAIMESPNIEWRVIERRGQRGQDFPWIEVREVNWTLGLKLPPLFRNGQRIR